ncbi:CHASE3 domain-containing protein [Caulobacter sp. S45]|uniref:sensor histidine kinase n=1 Tax=Caulobacter sp. S45 TaxID=1641861 RepID=UPI00131BB7B5|nr:CHASE3 domain-containing protein [Caulobacter sp. S45]
MTAAAITEAGAVAAEVRAARRVRQLMLLAVSLGFLVLVGVSILTVVLVSRDQDFTHWVNHTYQVDQKIGDLRVTLERTEGAQRGYLITGDALYLDGYRTSANRLPQLVETLRALMADNSAEQHNVDLLQSRITQMLAMQESTLQAARMDARPTDPAALIRADQPLLNAVRDIALGMANEEGRLLEERSSGQAANAEMLLVVELASGIMLALIAVGAFVLMRRYAADLDRSQLALRKMNEGLEDAVQARTQDLTRANEEIQRFAYIVSHDLRAPLVNIMGFTSELEVALKALHRLADTVEAEAPALMFPDARTAVEEDLPESIGFIRSSTQKMDRLINAILKLSREGRRTLNPEDIAMDALIEGIAASLQHQADAREAVVEIEGTLPNLQSDRLATEQVFGNIVENALKYLKPGRPGHVIVRGRTEGAFNIYEIQDNGRGIDAKDYERVFELFRRAGAQDQPGEGIGLAHVRALIVRLGGTISLESALDQGTTFRVSLPRTARRIEDKPV